jgi:cell envelope-related transcriptional attenuator
MHYCKPKENDRSNFEMREQDYYERGYDDEPRRSKKAKKRKRKQSGSRGERVVVTLLSLLFLTVAVVATVKYVVRAPEPVTDNEDQQTQQDGTAEDSDAIQTISNGRERKSKYCYNILLYGVDNDAGGSDTNMLMRFDAVNKTVDVVSLPRDTLMSNGHKLNSSYNNGGTEKLRSNIEDMLGVPVDFYVSVDLKGFITLIDQIDGVDFDVPEDMDYDDPYQDLHIHFKKGLQHLNGQQAMEVVRFRHNNDNTGYGGQQDLGRIGTQQAFLKTVAQKLMKLENVPAMAETFLKYVKTDLTLGNLVWLANQALSMGGTDAISFATLPGDGAGWYKGMSVYALDPEQVLEMTNSMLNPYVSDITADEQNILVP